jgi:hypothetical protein
MLFLKGHKFVILIFPLFGIFISVFPKIVIVPLEAIFGAGDHLSLGDLVVLCLPLLSGCYSFFVGVLCVIKKQFKNGLFLIFLCLIQIPISLVEWGIV